MSTLLRATVENCDCTFAFGSPASYPSLDGLEDTDEPEYKNEPSSNIHGVISTPAELTKDALRIVQIVQEHMAGDTRDARKEAIAWDLQDKFAFIVKASEGTSELKSETSSERKEVPSISERKIDHPENLGRKLQVLK